MKLLFLIQANQQINFLVLVASMLLLKVVLIYILIPLAPLDQEISFRITTTLKELQINESTKNFTNGETIQIQSLGIESSDKKTDDWIYNLKVKYKTKNISVLDTTEKRYLITNS